MKRRLTQMVRDNFETLVFASALAVIASLLLWWGVFAYRLVGQHAALAARSAASAAEKAAALAKGDRQLLMLSGEGAVFGVLLVVCVVALFVVTLRVRDSKRRMERLLQFTTHELKTPIAGVRALLQSMQLGSIPAEDRDRFLGQGLLEMNRLEHLTETILAWQRASSTRKKAPATAQSRALIDEIVAHRRQTFGDEKLEDGARVDAAILVERDAFRVVLENLLDNARKYGGGQVQLKETIEGDRYRLRLCDKGVGFEPHEGPALFDPFARADNGAAIHGSGLGLYISRQLVRDMNGELSATSEGKGRGATFTLELPLAGARHG